MLTCLPSALENIDFTGFFLVFLCQRTIIRSIFGAAGIDTRPLARAVDIAAELLFTHRQTIDELHFTRDIYSPVAVLLCGKNGEPQSVKTISKSIERLSNQCWDILVARGLVGKYIGAEIGDIHAPRDIIIYLAFYSHLGVPFFTAMEQESALHG